MRVLNTFERLMSVSDREKSLKNGPKRTATNSGKRSRTIRLQKRTINFLNYIWFCLILINDIFFTSCLFSFFLKKVTINRRWLAAYYFSFYLAFHYRWHLLYREMLPIIRMRDYSLARIFNSRFILNNHTHIKID